MAVLLSFLAMGCGESFQGKFVGDAYIVDPQCGIPTNNPYTMTADVRISGNDLEIIIEKFAPKSEIGNDGYKNRLAARIKAGMDDRGFFYVDNQTFSNNEKALVSSQGNLSSDRKQITALEVTLDLPLTNTSTGQTANCSIFVKADQLNLQK